MITNPYLTDGGKAKNLALLTSTERYEMLETLRQTEARDWIRRYRLKAKERGQQAWWGDVKSDIKKRRGQAGLDTLIAEMERQRDKSIKPV